MLRKLQLWNLLLKIKNLQKKNQRKKSLLILKKPLPLNKIPQPLMLSLVTSKLASLDYLMMLPNKILKAFSILLLRFQVVIS